MPEELQKKFDEYQLETVIHENYSQEQISRLVRRFNFNKPMNISQKTFTFCDRYARRIREILKREFFVEAPYTKVERRNGSVERIILETIMTMFHLNNWKHTNKIGAYLNENASSEEFNILENNIARLENIVTDDLYSLFIAKDSFLLFTLFYRFTELNVDDKKFTDFLTHFKEMTNGIDMNEFYGVDRSSSTKDKNIIIKKLDKLETLMFEYLGISEPESEEEPELDSEGILEFVRENVNPDVTGEDISQFAEVLDDLAEKSGYNGKLMEVENRASMVAMIARSFTDDVDLDDWFSDYCRRNSDYISDQVENYQHMASDLEQYLENSDAKHTEAA